MAKPSKQEWIEHLAKTLLETGEIVSNERPFKITTQDVVDHTFNAMQDEIPLEEYFQSWKDDDGEADVIAHEKMLEFTIEAAKDCIDVTIQDHQSDYSSWGKAE